MLGACSNPQDPEIRTGSALPTSLSVVSPIAKLSSATMSESSSKLACRTASGVMDLL